MSQHHANINVYASTSESKSPEEEEQGHWKPSRPAKRKKGSNKTTHISQACSGCRRRKTRCDGAVPACGTCIAYKDDCSYEPVQDGRKPVSREYVNALQQQISELQQALADYKAGTTWTSSEPTKVGLVEVRTDRNEEAHPPAGATEYASAAGKFKVVRRNHVLSYGPTSGYMHLTEDARQATNDRNDKERELVDRPQSRIGSEDDRDDTDEIAEKYGIHSAAECPGWNRWLPLNLPMDLHDEFLGYFFSYVNPFTLFVDEGRFFRDMLICTDESSSVTATAFYSPLLHNVLLGLGSKYSKDPRARSEVYQLDFIGDPIRPIDLKLRGKEFAFKAMLYLEEECNKPVLSTVIGCMLLGTYHQQSANATLGWVYEGVGVRVANVLGLHMNSADLVQRGVISSELKRAREYCWATVAFQDKLWSWTLGRIPSVRSSDVENVDPPVISAKMDAIPWLSFPRQHTLPGLRSTVMHHTARLTGLAERIHTLNYSMQVFCPSEHRMLRSQIHSELLQWYNELPASITIGTHVSRLLQPHVINLNIVLWYFVILLYRTHYVHSPVVGDYGQSPAETPASLCNAAACKIVSLLKLWKRQHGLDMAPPSLSNITFCTGTIFVLAAANESGGGGKKADGVLQHLADTISMCKEMGQSATFADRSADALRQMSRDWLSTPASVKTTQTPPARSSETSGGGKDDMSKRIAELTDPTSEFAQLLTKMGWRPPDQSQGQGHGQSSITQQQGSERNLYLPMQNTVIQEPPIDDLRSLPMNGHDDLHTMTEEINWPSLFSNASGANQTLLQSQPVTLNPTDFTFNLHPSYFANMDTQFSSIFPVHWGGANV